MELFDIRRAFYVRMAEVCERLLSKALANEVNSLPSKPATGLHIGHVNRFFSSG
jgi:hypothetical protein